MVPFGGAAKQWNITVERLRAPRPILIYGRIDGAMLSIPKVAPSHSRVLTPSASACGRELCRCPKKVHIQLCVSQREDNCPGRTVCGERIRGGKVGLALAESEGVRGAGLGDVPELFDSSGPIPAI